MSHRTEINLTQAATALLVLLLGSRVTWAQEAEESGSTNAGSVSFELSADWTSAYFFRGLLQEDKGSIIQPGAEASIRLMGDEAMSLSAVLGMWNSFHSKQTGATNTDSFVGSWYESDLYAGLGLDVSDWTIGAQFITYAYPNGAASSIDEVDLTVAYDDSALWRNNFAFNPYVLYAFETDDRGGSEDSYLEAGFSTSRSWEVSKNSAFTISIPFLVGFSVEDYYVSSSGEEDTIGYWDLGLDASYGIPVPARLGGWSLTAGVHYLSLGDAAKELNDNDEDAVVGRIGLSMSY